MEPTEGLSPAASEDELRELSVAVEALLFMSGAALSLTDLCELTGRPAEDLRVALDRLREQCEGRAVWVISVAGGFRLATRPSYGELVAKLLQPKRFRLSRAALETLAIIAYKQPVTRPEIEEIRGVNADGVMDTLMRYELVRECGHRQSPGRPMQYGTTENFLTHFGLDSVRDLPDLDRLGRPETAESEEGAESEIAGAAPPETELGETPPAADQEAPSSPMEEPTCDNSSPS